MVSAGRRYQRGVVMHNFCQFHHIIFSIYQFRIGGLPIPMEFKDIVLFTYILLADCMALSADPILLGLFRRLLSANRSLLSAGCLCTPFHTALQTQSSPRTQRRLGACSNSRNQSALLFQWSSVPQCRSQTHITSNTSLSVSTPAQ